MKVQGKTKLWEHWYWCLYYLTIYCLPTRLSKVQMMQKLAVFVSHLKGSLKSTYTRTQGTSWTVEITVICFHVNRKDTKCFWISILYCRSAGCFSHRQEDFSVSRVFSSSRITKCQWILSEILLCFIYSYPDICMLHMKLKIFSCTKPNINHERSHVDVVSSFHCTYLLSHTNFNFSTYIYFLDKSCSEFWSRKNMYKSRVSAAAIVTMFTNISDVTKARIEDRPVLYCHPLSIYLDISSYLFICGWWGPDSAPPPRCRCRCSLRRQRSRSQQLGRSSSRPDTRNTHTLHTVHCTSQYKIFIKREKRKSPFH